MDLKKFSDFFLIRITNKSTRYFKTPFLVIFFENCQYYKLKFFKTKNVFTFKCVCNLNNV